MNYILLLVGAYLALANSPSGNVNVNVTEWQLFKREHGKTYLSKQEDSLRSMIFSYNKHKVDEFNAKKSSQAGFKLALNHHGDLSGIEIKSLNGLRLPENHEQTMINSPEAQKFLDAILNDNSTTELPAQVDWRKVPGRVSQVKNQGRCGSCWAFATTGVLEGQEARNKSKFNDDDLVQLSEQNLVDCSKKNYGCKGGFIAEALNYVKSQGGIDDEQAYPYEAKDDQCRFKKNRVAFTDQGSALLPSGDEQKLKEVVAKFGPVAVGIDASDIEFQFYIDGVYYVSTCSNKPEGIDHAVLVVGYGTDPTGGDYWIVKNSWGTGWGIKGYIHMARNRGNNCGIATIPTIPTFSSRNKERTLLPVATIYQ